MIVDLPNTTTSAVAKKIQSLRAQGGVIALGRVLTLVVITKSGLEEEAIEAANEASREHPCRIIVLAAGSPEEPARLDAQLRHLQRVLLRGGGDLAVDDRLDARAAAVDRDDHDVLFLAGGLERGVGAERGLVAERGTGECQPNLHRTDCAPPDHGLSQRDGPAMGAGEHPEHLYGGRYRLGLDPADELAH